MLLLCYLDDILEDFGAEVRSILNAKLSREFVNKILLIYTHKILPIVYRTLIIPPKLPIISLNFWFRI